MERRAGEFPIKPAILSSGVACSVDGKGSPLTRCLTAESASGSDSVAGHSDLAVKFIFFISRFIFLEDVVINSESFMRLLIVHQEK